MYIHLGTHLKREFRAALESGANLNLCVAYRYAQWSSYPEDREPRFVNWDCNDVLYNVFGADFESGRRTKRIIFQKVLKFLLANGLSFFYNIHEYSNPFDIASPCPDESFLRSLFNNDLPLPQLRFLRAIALKKSDLIMVSLLTIFEITDGVSCTLSAFRPATRTSLPLDTSCPTRRRRTTWRPVANCSC